MQLRHQKDGTVFGISMLGIKICPTLVYKSSTDRMKTLIHLICQQPSEVNKLNFASCVDKFITEV